LALGIEGSMFGAKSQGGRAMLRWTTLILTAGLALVACGKFDAGTASSGAPNNGTPSNGSANHGLANNGTANIGATSSPSNAGPNMPNMKPVTPTGATVPTAADPLMNAENRDQVTQYADMVRLPPTPAKIVTGLSTTVRGWPLGKQVQVIQTGMTVNVIGKHGDYDLVLYPDPKNESKQLAGWVYKDAIDAASWPGIDAAAKQAEKSQSPQNAKTTSAPKLACTKGEAQLRSAGDFCAHPCNKDEDCAQTRGGVCDGIAYTVKKDGSTSSSMSRYCTLSSASVDRASLPSGKGNPSSTSAPTTPKQP
jgi:hypothetical protein